MDTVLCSYEYVQLNKLSSMSEFERNIYSIGKVVTCQNLAEMCVCVCGGGEGALTRLFKERAERGGNREY
jgi:hypothetical protein